MINLSFNDYIIQRKQITRQYIYIYIRYIYDIYTMVELNYTNYYPNIYNNCNKNINI